MKNYLFVDINSNFLNLLHLKRCINKLNIVLYKTVQNEMGEPKKLLTFTSTITFTAMISFTMFDTLFNVYIDDT